MSTTQPIRDVNHVRALINHYKNLGQHRNQTRRIIRNAEEAVNLPSEISCHSLRKTFSYHAWKSGVSPAVIMEIYNHSNLATTRRYLGTTPDDLDTVYIGLGL